MLNQSQVEAQPDGELQFWRSITRRLPHIRGSGRLSSVMERIYNRKKRSDTTADVLGFKMVLDSADCLERQFLFCPHLYDWKEINYLRKHLKPGTTFLDAGANVGFYSLIASGLVGETGAVLSVEADPYNASRLKANLEVNNMRNVRIANFGLSDRTEMLRLGRDTSGNRGGNSFLSNSPEGVTVQCHTLTDILLSEGIQKVDGAKMDIEGFEFKVLQRFFADGNSKVWPGFLIIEINPSFDKKTNGDTLALLARNGYDLTKVSELNYFAARK
jgi:FkbM family methyltransferase